MDSIKFGGLRCCINTKPNRVGYDCHHCALAVHPCANGMPTAARAVAAIAHDAGISGTLMQQPCIALQSK